MGGAGGVSLFLILSGYGIEKSTANGFDSYWKKRFPKVWIPYVLITIIALIGKGSNDWKNTALSLMGLDFGFLIDKTMWFISYIMLWYLGYYSFAKVGNYISQRKIILIAVKGIGLLAMIPVFMALYHLGAWSVNTGALIYLIMFPFGVFLGILDSIKIKKTYRNIVIVVAMICTIGILYGKYSHETNTLVAFTMAIIPLCLFIISEYKSSKMLQRLGEHSFIFISLKDLF